jgi:hypothetical protein
MKKVFLTGILFLSLLAVAWAAPRFVPTQIAPVTDQYYTTSTTIITDMSIYYVGVTAGNKLEFRNGGPTGTIFYTFVAPAAAGTYNWTPEKALRVDSGIYLDSTVTAGAFGLDLTYQ